MSVRFRHYAGGYGVSDDYMRLHDFLARRGYAEVTYARLDWMITHGGLLEVENLQKIGFWEDGGKIVAAALFDTSLDNVYLIALPEYECLKKEMLEYAGREMTVGNPDYAVAIPDTDARFQRLAMQMGYIATTDKEMDAAYDLIGDDGQPTPPPDPRPFLPEGYSIVTLFEERAWRKYLYCLHKGFGHEEKGEPFDVSPEYEEGVRAAMERAHVDLHLKIAVKAPGGEYAAYCGMWYDPRAGFGVIEPVATIPECRRLGLGRAAVTEGIRRVGALGAEFAVVGSSQQFYYSIGLRPMATVTFWKIRNK